MKYWRGRRGWDLEAVTGRRRRPNDRAGGKGRAHLGDFELLAAAVLL
jgi:hypothetical protein